MTPSSPHAPDQDLDACLSSAVRLRVCGYLAGCEEADFQAVQAYCDLTAPTLSKQVTTLLEHGYVTIRKVAAGRYTKTRLGLSGEGRAALGAHVAALRRIADQASDDAGLDPPLDPAHP